GTVGAIVHTEPVALPVEEPVAPLRLEDEIDEPAEIAMPVGSGNQPAVDAELAAHDVDDAPGPVRGARRHGGQGELELAHEGGRTQRAQPGHGAGAVTQWGLER